VFHYMKTFYIFATMMVERKILTYKQYFQDFINSIDSKAALKIFKVLDMLQKDLMVSGKFIKKIRDEIFELRISHNTNTYRVFFIYDNGNLIILFNGFQKKTQKTPQKEIEKAIAIKKEYYDTVKRGK